MTNRSSSRTVTFHRPFTLGGMETPHAPGTFEVRAEEEDLDVVWAATRSSLSLILASPGRTEAWAITGSELEEALARDRLPDTHVRGS